MSTLARQDQTTRYPHAQWVALAIIMAAAFIVRLYALGRLPSVVFHDECDNLFNVYQILNGKGPGFFGLDWKPQPAASVYLLSWSMRLGMSIVTLRFPAALFSVAALLPFYMLIRKVVVIPVALLASALLATDIWYLPLLPRWLGKHRDMSLPPGWGAVYARCRT